MYIHISNSANCFITLDSASPPLDICSTELCVCSVTSVVSNSVTLWKVACQATLSMGFFWQEYWSGLPCPPPGDLPILVIEPTSPALLADFFLLSH